MLRMIIRIGSLAIVRLRRSRALSGVSLIVWPAQFRAVFPEKSLRFLRIQALGDVSKGHHSKPSSGQAAAFTKDSDAGVLIERKLASHYRHHPQLPFEPWAQAKASLKLA